METSVEKFKDSKSHDLGVLCPRVRAKYVTEMYRDSKWKQFLNLKQRNLSVDEYEKEFSNLSCMHRNWSSRRHFGVGNLRMDCMIPSKDI